MEKYFILDKDGNLQGVFNEKPKDGVLFTTKDYADIKEPENNIKFDFELDNWINIKTL